MLSLVFLPPFRILVPVIEVLIQLGQAVPVIQVFLLLSFAHPLRFFPEPLNSVGDKSLLYKFLRHKCRFRKGVMSLSQKYLVGRMSLSRERPFAEGCW